jgi:hypothetical protein
MSVNAFYADGITCRQILAWAGAISGRFIRANAAGEVEFDWYGNIPRANVAPSRLISDPSLAVSVDGNGNASITSDNMMVVDDGNGNVSITSIALRLVDDGKGNIKGIVVNYANHLDNISPKKQYSADYVKYLRESLKEEYGEDITVLFFNGAAGDVNRNDYSDKNAVRASCEEIGRGIAETVIKLNRHIITKDRIEIQSLSEIHQTVRRKETQEQYEWAAEVMERHNKGYSVGSMDLAFASEYIEPEDPNLPDTVDMEIHTLVIDNYAIVGVPGEIFSEIGLGIKEASPYKLTMVIELANGTHGYLTPDNIQMSETYEAKYSKYNAYTGLGTADMIIKQSKNMLTKLKNGTTK